MAYVTSIINLKGGVGKTTITLALAHFLALEHRKRVLVIDLDPQTNATVCLIPEKEWEEARRDGAHTLPTLLGSAQGDACLLRRRRYRASGLERRRGD